MAKEWLMNLAAEDAFPYWRQLRVNDIVSIVKEPDNLYDSQAIMVIAPTLNMEKVGYMANTLGLVADGCISGRRAYASLPNECCGEVRYMTSQGPIFRVFPDKRLTVEIHMNHEPLSDLERLRRLLGLMD